MSSKKTGFVLASAVAGLFASACATSSTASAPTASKDAQTATAQCSGINSCKGQGSCSGASNACKSQNSCKGQGWVETASARECTDKGGKVVAAQ